MSVGLPIIIVDDDPLVCEVIYEYIMRFYLWGKILPFVEPEEALIFCEKQQTGVAIFILDVFLRNKTAFTFLDAVLPTFPMAPQDTIIITGNANDEVVDMCIAADINYLLEKPIRPYALQLAIRAIVSKYVKFSKRLLLDATFAEHVWSF